MTVRLIANADRDAWSAALPDEADVYFDPGYVATAGLGDPTWLAIVESEGGRLIIPFVEHALPAWLDTAEWHDAESPYGYAGVLASGDGMGWPACWREFTEALVSRSIVNVFLRLNPVLPFDAALPYLLPWEQSTVWIPLADGLRNAFAGHAVRTHRSQVSRARALQFATEIIVDPAPTEIEGFRVLYNETMERVGAARWYRFPASYFEELRIALGPRLVLIRVRDRAGDTQGEALIMRGPRWGHYHLSARRPDAHNVSGHLLLQATAEWGSANGLAGIHLGGGVTSRSDDSLLKFKSKIGRMRATFRTAGIIAIPAGHRALLARWQAATGQQPTRFQAYRQAPATLETAT